MKQSRLTLNELKVDSFITSLETHKTNTVMGGSSKGCAAIASLVVVVVVGVVAYNAATNAMEEIAKKKKEQLDAIEE